MNNGLGSQGVYPYVITYYLTKSPAATLLGFIVLVK